MSTVLPLSNCSEKLAYPNAKMTAIHYREICHTKLRHIHAQVGILETFSGFSQKQLSVDTTTSNLAT